MPKDGTFQSEAPIIEKARFCLVVVWAKEDEKKILLSRAERETTRNTQGIHVVLQSIKYGIVKGKATHRWDLPWWCLARSEILYIMAIEEARGHFPSWILSTIDSILYSFKQCTAMTFSHFFSLIKSIKTLTDLAALLLLSAPFFSPRRPASNLKLCSPLYKFHTLWGQRDIDQWGGVAVTTYSR